jgi:hypothetical protein
LERGAVIWWQPGQSPQLTIHRRIRHRYQQFTMQSSLVSVRSIINRDLPVPSSSSSSSSRVKWNLLPADYQRLFLRFFVEDSNVGELLAINESKSDYTRMKRAVAAVAHIAQSPFSTAWMDDLRELWDGITNEQRHQLMRRCEAFVPIDKNRRRTDDDDDDDGVIVARRGTKKRTRGRQPNDDDGKKKVDLHDRYSTPLNADDRKSNSSETEDDNDNDVNDDADPPLTRDITRTPKAGTMTHYSDLRELVARHSLAMDKRHKAIRDQLSHESSTWEGLFDELQSWRLAADRDIHMQRLLIDKERRRMQQEDLATSMPIVERMMSERDDKIVQLKIRVQQLERFIAARGLAVPISE